MTLTWDLLIPAYNAEATIAAAVESAWAQDPRPEQVLVYSDGSTDETVLRARAAGAQVIAAVDNRGVGVARQTLLEHARAPWIVVLDADDRLLPGAGELFRRAVEERPSAWVLGFGEIPDATPETEAAVPGRSPLLDPARPMSLRTLWSRNRLISSSTLIRRSAAVEVGGFPPVRRLVDYAFWLLLADRPDAAGRLWNHTVPVTARAVNAGTITGDVVAAVRSERELLLRYASAALAGLPSAVAGALTTARLCELWWRGLSRHLDYGRPAASYLRPGDVVPGSLLPRTLALLTREPVRRCLRSAAAALKRASGRAERVPPSADPLVVARPGDGSNG